VTARAAAAVLSLLVLLLGGCGVPTSGEPETIAASDVPYGLASPTPSATSSSSAQTMFDEAGIYLVTPEDVLVPRGREVASGPLEAQLQELLRQLAVGPSREELAEELSTALPPEVELVVTEIEDGVVTVDIAGPVDAPTGTESRRAVAQIVLTATSLPEVDAVQLTRAGERIEAPLPDGELTAEPLTADDFAPFLTAPAPSATTSPAAPSAAPATPTTPPTPAGPTS
jgi:hypothetical protein